MFAQNVALERGWERERERERERGNREREGVNALINQIEQMHFEVDPPFWHV